MTSFISHYSPHRMARLCFSHDATYRPSGCQATALTMDLQGKMQTEMEKKIERIFFRSHLSISSKENIGQYLFCRNWICFRLLESRGGWDQSIVGAWWVSESERMRCTYECSLLSTFSILPVVVFQMNNDPSLPPAHACAQSGERTALIVSDPTLKSSWLEQHWVRFFCSRDFLPKGLYNTIFFQFNQFQCIISWAR